MSPWVPYLIFLGALVACLAALMIGSLSGRDGMAGAGLLAALLLVGAPIVLGWVA